MVGVKNDLVPGSISISDSGMIPVVLLVVEEAVELHPLVDVIAIVNLIVDKIGIVPFVAMVPSIVVLIEVRVSCA